MVTALIKKFQQTRYQIIILVLFVLIAYLRSLPSAFVSDDVEGIVNNPTIGNFSAVFQNLKDIITPLLYFIIYKIFGANTVAFRSLNILFHIGTVILVYLLITKIWNRTAGFITAGLYAVHPILTEPVIWISGGHYVRYGFFFMLSFYLYLISGKNKALFISSLVAYLLALGSSAMAISLPIVLLLYNFAQRKSKSHYLELIPFFLLTIFYAAIFFVSAVSTRVNYLGGIHYNYAIGYSYNPLLVAPVALTTYWQLLFLPAKLTFYHTEIFSYFAVFIRALVILAYLGITVFFYFKNRLIAFWLAFFLVCLALVISPLQVSSASIAERYVYIASIGIIAPVGYFLYFLIKKYGNIMWTVFAVLMILLTVRTLVRGMDWYTYESFWMTALKLSPNSYQAHNNVGSIYFNQGDLQDAAIEFQKSIAIVPDLAETHYNLGTVYFTAKMYPEAIQEFQKAVTLQPNDGTTYQNMAAAYFKLNDLKKSEEMTNKALALMPGNEQVLLNLGIIYLAEDKRNEAKAIFQKILAADPTNEKAKSGLQQLEK